MDTPKKPRARNPARMPAVGPGWGGPAKGVSPPFAAGAKPGPGRGHISEHKIASAARLKEIISTIAEDSSVHPQTRVIAADKLLDRMEGKALQRSELTGKDGGPLQTQQLEDPRPPIEAMFKGKQEDEEATKH